ncbi:MAG: penicillin-binding protein 1A [Gammaproteobacteria bacterium]|nr:penicillin-binding protein 1A [Gammaproteobacteria bacterium]MBU6509816.1 penicillin-binding protein 1A [Gammaproteobacteria bacterium]MDE1983685.1 penicillin-binding protein 1A [Gammaproteobacteria bacterium]MDE2107839.1 penicillin-binding protein 1A [Gammaproteobacteria bacterium]
MKRSLKTLYVGLGVFAALCGLGVLAVIVAYLVVAPSLPSVAVLKDIHLQVPLRVYSRDGELLAVYGEKRRIPLDYAQIPKPVIDAFVAAEDEHYWDHPGVSIRGLLRAAIHLALTGQKTEGGGTITMQVARNFFLTREKTYTRKLKEVFLALKIERELSKQDILDLYLNKIYLGNRAYGVGAAAEVYYGSDVNHLTLPQIAMIAGLPKAPSTDNPLVNPQRALVRRGYVLGRMLADGYITQQQYQQAMTAPMTASYHEPTATVNAPYLAEMVRDYMVNKYGDDAYTAGYSVVTTIDSRLQPLAINAVRRGLLAYDQRHGWRGALAHIDLPPAGGPTDWAKLVADEPHVGGLYPAIAVKLENQSVQFYADAAGLVTVNWDGLKWARRYLNVNATGPAPTTASSILKRGDIVYLERAADGSWFLSQIPTAQAALVCIDPFDGAIAALVGGFDFGQSKFNRAVQAQRQPGSSFKPFYYSAALEDGLTAATVINDAPVVVQDPALANIWRPQNYENEFGGPTRLRMALAHSLNLVSIRVLQQIGVPYAINYATKFGFDAADLPDNLTLALGSASLTPLEMARGYAVFANHGFRVTPYYIQSIVDGSGHLLFAADPQVACDSCSVDTTAATSVPAPAAASSTGAANAVPPQMPQFAPQAITPQNAWLMTSMLQSVVQFGTGAAVASLGRSDLAGKTGTSNDWSNAWFDGFNNDIVTVVWVGNDQPSQSLGDGEQGAKAALPIWMDFMGPALHDVPQLPFLEPPGIVQARIDPKTGLLAGANDPGSIFEYFLAGHLPPKAPPKKQANGSDIF